MALYGLTATPKRDDGQDRKIFLQLGPIRFRYTAKDRAKKQGIGHYVYPRFTRFVHLSEKPPAMAELNQLVIESEGRNAQILSDTEACVQNGRTPLVMTKYKEHARLLKYFIAVHGMMLIAIMIVPSCVHVGVVTLGIMHHTGRCRTPYSCGTSWRFCP